MKYFTDISQPCQDEHEAAEAQKKDSNAEYNKETCSKNIAEVFSDVNQLNVQIAETHKLVFE